MASLNQVLRSVITRKHEFCCLCLKPVEGNPVNVQDIVVLKNENETSKRKLLDILAFVFAAETCNNIAALEVLCEQCTHSVVFCYKFIILSKENTELLTNALLSLTKSFEDSPDFYYDSKTLYVTLNKTSLATQQYYDNKSVNTTPLAFQRFQALFEINSKLIKNEPTAKKRVHQQKVKKEIEYPTQTKRRQYFSLPVKTSDMLYDKRDRSILKCKVCLKSFPKLSNVRNHFIRVHAPKNYKCSICERKFGSIALLETHKTESHCSVVCTECGKTFNNRHTLKMHETSHNLKVVCQNCGRVYRSQTTYKRHIDLNICGQKTRASPANAKFTCDYCNKKYTQKVSLRVHIQYEHGNYKGHECKWCKKKFWAQSRLKAHIVKHTQEKKFQCNICGGKFVTKESLLYHTRTHTGEKPYKCEICDSRFLSASRRADHTKRHHSVTTFLCTVCNIRYTTKVCYEEHLKTHKNTNSEVELNENVRYMLETNDVKSDLDCFPCDICGLKCTSQVELDEHKKTHDKNDKTLTLKVPGVQFSEYEEIFLTVSKDDDEYDIM